jgi:DNA-binding NarL/FixJ family response regulator
MVEDPAIAAEALKLGKCGYVLKRSAASELVAALHQVLRKRTYVTPLITGEVLGALDTGTAERGPGQPLTARQRQVLQLLAQGHSMKQVAQILRLAPGTVAFHKYRIMEHLHIHTSAQLVQFAVRHHLD